MPTAAPITRSLACIELLGFLDDADDVAIELDVLFEDGDEPVRMRHLMRASRRVALRVMNERCAALEASARSSCCLIDVPHLEAKLFVDGECVSVARFPEAAARVIAPAYDALLRAMRAQQRDRLEAPTAAATAR